MSALVATQTRFEAVRLSGGWTVADLWDGAAIVRSRPWDEAEADAVTDALNAAPGYAVQFRWAALDARELPAASASMAAHGGER